MLCESCFGRARDPGHLLLLCMPFKQEQTQEWSRPLCSRVPRALRQGCISITKILNLG